MLNSLDGLTELEYRMFEDIACEVPDLVVDNDTERILVNRGLVIVNEILQHFDSTKAPKLIKNYVVPGPVKHMWLCM